MLNLWQFNIISVTLTFNLPEQIFQKTLLLLKENNRTKLFLNPCINIEFMAPTSSIYDYFIIWPSSVTLTFNLPEPIFKMAPSLFKEKNCAKLVWNPSTNVQVMALTNPGWRTDGRTDACTHTHTPNSKRVQSKGLILNQKSIPKKVEGSALKQRIWSSWTSEFLCFLVLFCK